MNAELAPYYAARAREYERIYEKPERQTDLARLKHLIPGYFTGLDVLEIACGTGYWTQFIAPVARKVTGIDINQETLDIAATKRFPPGRVSLEVADVQRLADGYRGYTGAFAGFWWSHLRLSERGPFLDTLHRALAPGAVVVFLDNAYVEGSSTPIAYTDAEGNAFQRRKLDDGSQHDVLKNFPTEAHLRIDLGNRGTAVEHTALDYYWLFKYESAGLGATACKDHGVSFSP